MDTATHTPRLVLPTCLPACLPATLLLKIARTAFFNLLLCTPPLFHGFFCCGRWCLPPAYGCTHIAYNDTRFGRIEKTKKHTDLPAAVGPAGGGRRGRGRGASPRVRRLVLPPAPARHRDREERGGGKVGAGL